MAIKRQVERYAAYYFNWCQAFGEHDAVADETGALTWLVGEDRVGVILAARERREILRELMHQERATPELTISPEYIQVNDTRIALPSLPDTTALDRLRGLFEGQDPLHLFLTYHVFYPAGTRIITFSRKHPLGLLYKTVGKLQVRLR
ncbi:hypothetical protein [Thioalbus denitrificans]|uniref:Uncharacterized protein n=1 Tax=Thioalbus denitrificans TaxID=547122 RepID=A0A369C318_9GAMM|nr:hypothetical protein [Thioalbus denitrificans]RCX28382.1 hypothetical protein DFQ59_107129 [Thioalbus denitrificans]